MFDGAYKKLGYLNKAHTKKVRLLTVANEEEKELMCAAVEIKPSSVRDLELEFNMNRETFRIVLRKKITNVLRSKGFKNFIMGTNSEEWSLQKHDGENSYESQSELFLLVNVFSS